MQTKVIPKHAQCSVSHHMHSAVQCVSAQIDSVFFLQTHSPASPRCSPSYLVLNFFLLQMVQVLCIGTVQGQSAMAQCKGKSAMQSAFKL